MAYGFKNSTDLDGDLKWLSAGERAVIKKALPKYLRDDPTRRSTHRKKLESNPLGAEWELRLGDLRVLYSVDEDTKIVQVLNAGKKDGNALYIRGTAYDLREQAEAQ
jgi:mRNA-degrading endonuclease RelE of RelBE toxin-antitoxin system